MHIHICSKGIANSYKCCAIKYTIKNPLVGYTHFYGGCYISALAKNTVTIVVFIANQCLSLHSFCRSKVYILIQK